METLLYALISLAMHWLEPRHNAQLQFLREQVSIHLNSRKVYASPATYAPNGAWVTQQGRNARMWLEEEGLEPRFLVHDGDAKFSAHFKESWRPEVRCLRTPPRAPTANA
jgi:putative transposase